MRRTFLLVVGTGIGAILVAGYLAVVDPTPVSPAEPLEVALLVAIGLLGAGIWRLWNARRRTGSESGDGLERGRPADRPAGGPGGGPVSDPSGRSPERTRGGPSAGPPADGPTGGPAADPAHQGPADPTVRHDDRPDEADPGGTSEPWDASIPERMFEQAPERTPANRPLAGESLARLTEDACRVASEEGRVEPSVSVVRPTLRKATRAVLVRSGLDEATATARLDSGEWTDDRLAASVLSREVAPPPVPLRKRLRRWLFPETVVRERIARAVDALAETAGARLPTVVGQNAPRPVPVAPPTLEDRQRHPDGSLGRGPPEALHGRTEPKARPSGSEPGARAGRGDLDIRSEEVDPEAGPRRGDPGAHGRARNPARDDRRRSGPGRTGLGVPGQGRIGRRQDGDRKPDLEPDKDDDRDGPAGRNGGQEDGV